MKYKKYILPNIVSVDVAIKELWKLKFESDYDPYDRKTGTEKIHKFLSKFVFSAAEKGDCESIRNILEKKELISKKDILNNEGQNIIEYCLINGKNDLFFKLLKESKECIMSYFSNIPKFFTIVMNNKNYELIDFFIREENFSEQLKKESIVNVFFIAVEGNKGELAEFIAKKFDNLMDVRNIEASMIFFIANDKIEGLEMIFQQQNLIDKFTIENFEKMVAYSVINKNTRAIKVMMENKHFIDLLNSADLNMQKAVLNILNENLLE
jgi:hypothetical protein